MKLFKVNNLTKEITEIECKYTTRKSVVFGEIGKSEKWHSKNKSYFRTIEEANTHIDLITQKEKLNSLRLFRVVHSSCKIEIARAKSVTNRYLILENSKVKEGWRTSEKVYFATKAQAKDYLRSYLEIQIELAQNSIRGNVGLIGFYEKRLNQLKQM